MNNQPRTIKAVVFDMDGVLIEARDWHYESLNKALQLFGYEISRHDHLLVYDGLPTGRKLEMLTLERGLPRELHGFINEMKQQYTTEMIHARCRPLFRHEYALARLKSEGYRLVLASNSIRSSIELMMKYAHLDVYLDFVLSNQDVLKGKPDPEIYQLAFLKLNLSPMEVLIVEDSETGLAAARASGGNVLAVRDTSEVTYQNILHAVVRIDNELKIKK
jgi:beta-phosphoglucomutase